MTCKDCINFEWCKSQNSEKISYYDGLSCDEVIKIWNRRVNNDKQSRN